LRRFHYANHVRLVATTTHLPYSAWLAEKAESCGNSRNT
jgi:hypothetical protein